MTGAGTVDLKDRPTDCWIMKVLSVVGYRKSGKTTTIEGLIPLLRAEGRVATVKSLHHEVEIDTPGKDTHRHRESGAETVVGITPSLTFSVTADTREKERRLQETLTSLESRGFDFVVVEGFKSVPLPAVAIGEVEESAVEGTIHLRAADGDSADVETIADLVCDLPDWEGDATAE